MTTAPSKIPLPRLLQYGWHDCDIVVCASYSCSVVSIALFATKFVGHKLFTESKQEPRLSRCVVPTNRVVRVLSKVNVGKDGYESERESTRHCLLPSLRAGQRGFWQLEQRREAPREEARREEARPLDRKSWGARPISRALNVVAQGDLHKLGGAQQN